MKKKFVRTLIGGFVSLLFIFSTSSCGNENKYLKGDICGNATVDGTTYNLIRKSYCEMFVYELNQPVLENAAYSAYTVDFKNEFANRYLVENNQVKKVEPGTDEYVGSHYLFTYYTEANKPVINDYINSIFTDSTKANAYIEITNFCAYGNSSEPRYGYFDKVASTEYDTDAKEVTLSGTAFTVKSVKDRMLSHSKACLVFTDGFIDPQTDNRIVIPKTKWKDGWDTGLLYGLFVYPMGALVNLFVNMFGGTAWGQIVAILLVTIVLKVAIFLLTYKSQSSTQKMQDIQPEILQIQAKYGQNPSAEDKQRMSMELMQVYQKHGVKPLAPFASLLITFPVFIAMYRAVMYLGVLRTGNLGGVILGNTLSSYIIGEYRFNFVALVIFILMAASQIVSMKVPNLLNSKKMTAEAKAQQAQANSMTNIMMIMILFMGFMMPVTMSIYWIASALVSVVQSVVMHKINEKHKANKKTHKEFSHTAIPQGYIKK